MRIRRCLFMLLFSLCIAFSPGNSEELMRIGMGGGMESLPAHTAKRISMDFENVALKSILKAFSRQTGVNFVASEIIEGKQITVFLDNVSFEDALSSILDANGLAYERQGKNVYLIKPAGTEPIRTVTRVFRLNYIQVYDMALQAEGEGFAETAAFQLTGETTAAAATTTSTTASSQGEKPKNIIEIIQSLMSEHGKIVADRTSNSLIITDIPSVFSQITDTIRELDVEPIQVMIQAEIIETTTDVIKRIGLEIGTATQTLGITYGRTSDGNDGQRLIAPIGYPFTEHFAKQTFGADLLTSGIFQYGTLTAADAEVILKLFASDSNTKFLSKPRVMTLNNRAATIKVSANTAIGVESVSVTDTSEVIEKAERVETGVILKVIPQVNANGDIFMYLEPSIARAQTSTFFTTQFLDPQVRSATSNVMVKDGDTVIIAGLIKTDNYRTMRKVPFLSDIPILGEPFKSRYKKIEDTEVLIFVTPHIVKRRAGTEIIPRQMSDREMIIQETLDRHSGGR